MNSDLIEVELTSMAHGGSALGRVDKRTIFIPYTIPGERVSARILQDKGRIAFAEGVQLIEASNDRVFPRCPHFGPARCGRCHWQHIAYGAQVALKQDVLADQLSRVGGFDDITVDAVLRPILPSPIEWGYNHHMTLERSAVAGQFGFHAADDAGVFVFDECHLLHPDLLALYHSLDMEADFVGIRKITLQIGSDGDTMLILAVDSEDDAPELAVDMPTSVNLLLPDNEPVNLVGESHSRYVVGGRRFRVTAGSSFRPNIAALETLTRVVYDALHLQPEHAVLDLYGGVGLFSAFVAAQARLVTLIESYPPAVTDADTNLDEFENVDLIEGSVEDVLPSLDDQYDAVIVDPPSSGLSLEAVDALAARAVPRLIYVSSDPATLARDSARLVKHGYRLTMVQPLDLSPQTYYIDTVAAFER